MSRINVADESVEQLMHNATQPDVMEDGNLVAIENAQGRIMITDQTGANRKSIVTFENIAGYRGHFHGPRISYDQRYICYDGYYYIQVTYVVDAQTGELIATIGDYNNSNQHYYSPSWAPDGSIIVQGAPTRNNGIYRVTPDFTMIKRLDPDLTNVSQPSVSPDGNFISFIRDGQLWTMNFDGSDPVQITSNLFEIRSPTWSPDSKYIAVTSQGRIYIVNLEALTIEMLQNGYVDEEQICWK